MTDREKVIITEMRQCRKGYTEIAKAMGINLNTIKSYCFRHGLNTSALKAQQAKCLNCGKPLPPKRTRPAMYCSEKCKMKYWRKHRTLDSEKLIETHCVICGKVIKDYASANRKYCSKECFCCRSSKHPVME